MPITHISSSSPGPSWNDVSTPISASAISSVNSSAPTKSIIQIKPWKGHMRSIRTTSNKKSRGRSSSTSRVASREQDRTFQTQHENTMARQQFHTRTERRPTGAVMGIGGRTSPPTPQRSRQPKQERKKLIQMQEQEHELELEQFRHQQHHELVQFRHQQQQQPQKAQKTQKTQKTQQQPQQPQQQFKGKPVLSQREATKLRSISNPRAGYSVHTIGSFESSQSMLSRRSEAGPIVEKASWEKPTDASSQNTDDDKLEGAKRVIQDLNRAIGHERRIAAISNACDQFDHWDTDRHNAELELGGANMLCLVLSMTDHEDEIRMICAALEMVYRASTEVVRKSFQDGGPAVIPLLLKLLLRCEEAKMSNAEVSIINISKVLLYFSRVSELRGPLAQYPDLLTALARVGTSDLNPDSRVLRIRVIANLSNYEGNKMLMMEHDDLLPSVLKIAALDLSEGAREFAAACLMDIASSPSTQAQLAQNDKVLSTLVKLAVMDDKDETREYAITAMQNLAFSQENRLILVQFTNGVVLEALKKIVSTDRNDKARRRAAGALTNLACDETADVMANHNGLIDIIARVTTHDKNYDVQKRACLALTKIASSCTPENKSFVKMMSVLVTAATSPNSTGIPAVFRLEARNPSRRVAMARLPGILETLADMSSAKIYSLRDKENAMRAIMHLTNEAKNRKILCSKVILNALVEASNIDDTDMSETRDSAIMALERLAIEVSNRQYMARHDNLLISVSRATERESKSELAGEKITQPRLAKQLLMSLLLAM